LSLLTIDTLHTRPRGNNGFWIAMYATPSISRAVFVFNMDHSNNLWVPHEGIRKRRKNFYLDCFPTVEDLARMLAKNRREEYITANYSHDACVKMGRDILNGKGIEVVNGHLLFNYARYAKLTSLKYPKKEVFAVRTEKL
jgi:hypothetical protein